MEQNETVIYPKATSDGFYFLDESDEALHIETSKNDKGVEIKRIVLSDKRVAVIRELKAWESEQSRRFHKNDEDSVLIAMATTAVLIDERKIPFEEMKAMRNRDWVKIKTAVAQLNFL